MQTLGVQYHWEYIHIELYYLVYIKFEISKVLYCIT